ncbi:RNase A-like domain-containing protein [Streptomyces sp. NPDC046931]|uniref:RNase A-like domain-containing protein n=1 Tax=Streptomyces sp. NPDC046931 TaxID=3154806 RepID=UPI0033C3E45C
MVERVLQQGPGVVCARLGLAPRTVYDLTVGGLHTFFVHSRGEGSTDVLVHNCTSVRVDEGKFGAHTIEKHVDVPDQQAWNRAQSASGPGIVGVWTDEATAEKAVEQAMREWESSGNNAQKLKDWKDREARKQGKPGYIFNPKTDALPIGTFATTRPPRAECSREAAPEPVRRPAPRYGSC